MRGFYVTGITILALATFGFLSLARGLDERRDGLQEVGEELAYLPSAEYLKPALLGFDELAADFFWLQTIQYFGEHYQTDRRYSKLYPLVDLVTSLDPQFIDAFSWGGLLLTLDKQYPEAIAIYEKGIAHNPDRWELPYDLGRVYYLELHDYPKALHWWELANRLPNRAHYLPRMVARLYAQTGYRETAVELWLEMYRSTDNNQIRAVIRQELEKLGIQVQ
ncbi:MAG: tetratricopeptide repeat protein [Candidatus Methylomirabilales bacterium]